MVTVNSGKMRASFASVFSLATTTIPRAVVLPKLLGAVDAGGTRITVPHLFAKKLALVVVQIGNAAIYTARSTQTIQLLWSDSCRVGAFQCLELLTCRPLDRSAASWRTCPWTLGWRGLSWLHHLQVAEPVPDTSLQTHSIHLLSC